MEGEREPDVGAAQDRVAGESFFELEEYLLSFAGPLHLVWLTFLS